MAIQNGDHELKNTNGFYNLELVMYYDHLFVNCLYSYYLDVMRK